MAASNRSHQRPLYDDGGSHCEHHMAPILGKAHVAYLPRDKVVGISKLARVVHFAFYALLFAIPLSGWALASAEGEPLNFFRWFDLPLLGMGSEDTLEEVHEVLFNVLVALAAMSLSLAETSDRQDRPDEYGRQQDLRDDGRAQFLVAGGGSGNGCAAPGGGENYQGAERGPDELSHPIPDGVAEDDALVEKRCQRDRGVEVSARDMTDPVDHDHDHQAE